MLFSAANESRLEIIGYRRIHDVFRDDFDNKPLSADIPHVPAVGTRQKTEIRIQNSEVRIQHKGVRTPNLEPQTSNDYLEDEHDNEDEYD